MSCERYRDVLSDVAAGAPAPAGIDAHLASCPACRAELTGLRQVLGEVDEELARLHVALPSPELVTRIRAAVGDSADAEPAWRLAWGLPLALAAVALVVATVFVAQRSPRPEPARVAGREPARVATPAPESVSMSDQTYQPLAAAPPASSPSRRDEPREPEVLVPAGEAEALVRLAASLRRRSVAPDSLLVADLTAPLAQPQLAELRALSIVPLDPAESTGAE